MTPNDLRRLPSSPRLAWLIIGILCGMIPTTGCFAAEEPGPRRRAKSPASPNTQTTDPRREKVPADAKASAAKSPEPKEGSDSTEAIVPADVLDDNRLQALEVEIVELEAALELKKEKARRLKEAREKLGHYDVLQKNFEKLKKRLEHMSRLQRAMNERPHPLMLSLEDEHAVEFVYIPPGDFGMGRTGDDVRRSEGIAAQVGGWAGGDTFRNSSPKHNVSVVRGFFLARCEITNGQYSQFDPDYKDKSIAAFGDLESVDAAEKLEEWESLPAANITWREAMRFCLWLEERNPGFQVRLPTEIEWEYAARGASGNVFARADGLHYERTHERYIKSHPVTAEPGDVSWCRAVGMSGNVSEWCADLWSQDVYHNRGHSTSPLLYDPAKAQGFIDAGENAMNVERVYRGGAFSEPAPYWEATTRRKQLEQNRSDKIGFRPAVILKDWNEDDPNGV